MTDAETSDSKPRHGQAILKWWAAAMGERNAASAKALSARLRRAGAIEALAEPAVHVLAQKLELKPLPHDAQKLLRVACVLAWVREHDAAKLAERLGRGEAPLMSPLRFQALMRVEGADLLTAMRRAVTLAKYKCNVAALGEDLLAWNDDTRTKWSFQYFGATAPHPDTDPSHPQEPTP